MNWLIEEYDGVVVTKMSSNKLNLMNEAFFNDLNNAFDEIEENYPNKPVILTSMGNVFSAGLDLNHCYSVFRDGNKNEIREWFENFRDSILRVFLFDRPIVAAINGHAIAGGLILAMCCDIRIAVSTNSKFGLNEVTVGFPLPNVFAEIIKYVIGSRRAEEAIFRGVLYDSEEALKLGIFHDITDEKHLFDKAMSHATQISEDSMYAYMIAKKSLREEVIQKINTISENFDKNIPDMLSSRETLNSIENILNSLKGNTK